MSGKKRFSDPIDHQRHIAYCRWKCQADYREEPVNLTMEQWFTIWTREFWARRGRQVDALCLIRKDLDRPWEPGNLALINRKAQLTISNRRVWNLPVDHIFEQAVWKDYV
jgi:hypothetical protein